MKLKVEGLNEQIKKYERYAKEYSDNIEEAVEKCVVILERSVQEVITDYNSGELRRGTKNKDKKKKPDKVEKPQKRKKQKRVKQKGKGPLIRTGKYQGNWNGKVKRVPKGTLGILFNNTDYAKLLEEGTSKMEAFRVVNIAYERVKKDIRRTIGEAVRWK